MAATSLHSECYLGLHILLSATQVFRARRPHSLAGAADMQSLSVESGFEAHALISPQQGRWGLLSRMRLTNRKKISGCGLLCAHAHYLRRSRAREDGASCQLCYSITEDSNTHDRFAVALSAPGVGVIGHVRTYLASFSCGATLFAPRRDAYLQSIWEKTTWQGSEVPCLYTCPRCATVDQSQYRAIFFDQKRMCLISSTKDRKERGALMIQVRL